MKPVKNNDKIEYYARLRARWRGISVCRSRMYCHGYIKAIKRNIFGKYYIVKNAKDERIDIVRPRQIFGKI